VNQFTFPIRIMRLEKYWEQYVGKHLGEDGIGGIVRYEIGPLPILCALMLLLAIIFTSAFRKSKKLRSFILAFASSALSVFFAWIWVTEWTAKVIRSIPARYLSRIYWAPVAIVILIAGIMMIRCLICAKSVLSQKHIARRELAEKNRRLTEETRRQTETQSGAAVIQDFSGKYSLSDAGFSISDAEDDLAFEKIRALHDLKKRGFLTEEEFEQKKTELLERI